MKYKYIGQESALLIELHKELQRGDVIESDVPLDNVFLVLIEEKKNREEKKSRKDGDN